MILQFHYNMLPKAREDQGGCILKGADCHILCVLLAGEIFVIWKHLRLLYGRDMF